MFQRAVAISVRTLLCCLGSGWLLAAVSVGPLAAEPVKLQGVLAQLAAGQLNAQALSQRGVSLSQGQVRVVVETSDPSLTPQLETSLLRLGAERVAAHGPWIRADLAPSALRAAAALPEAAYVRLPYAARPTATRSEGVALIGANAFLELGYQGQGITVAVIDLGFEGWTEARARDELGADTQAVDFTSTGIGGIAHGTAVAEIIHDVAPGATLVLMKVANEVELGQAVEEALRLGTKVINHSVVWFNTEFGDGTGGVSQVAANAVARGAVWVNAAGNTALTHWKGPYLNRDDDSWVDFDVRGSESLPLEADQGTTIEVFLNWDAWPRTDVDYDLYMTYDANGNGVADLGEVFVSSTDPQRGLDPPVEHVRLFAPFTGQYLISVMYKGSLPPPALEVFTTQHTLRTPVREGSVLAPATAPGVLAVGAISAALWGQGTLQPFSARGPTNDGRIKPELVAPDNVSNFSAERYPFQFNNGRFVGTSAATPHVAGAAALLFSESPGMTATQAFAQLTRNALALPPSVPNNQSGFGKVSVQLAPNEELPLSYGGVSASATVIEVGQAVTFSIRVNNPHRRTVGQTVALVVDGRTVTVQDIVIQPSETRTVVFQWRFESLGTFSVSLAGQAPTIVRVVNALEVRSVVLRPDGPRSLVLEVDASGVVSVRLTVYDLSGRMVILSEEATSRLHVTLQDRFGLPLANGVYLYHVTVVGLTRTQQMPVRLFMALF